MTLYDADVRAFYDALADDYHLVYADWNASVRRQADALNQVIARRRGPGSLRVLDASCGIGTQAIGLAALGHDVVGTDLSLRAIARARSEAERAGVQARFEVCDVRALATAGFDVFDVVISCDNALPHLTSERDLRLGVRNMIARLRPGGMIIATTRDYDAILQDLPRVTTPSVMGEPGQRRVVFQIWDWKPDGRTYEFEQVLGRESPDGWRFEVGKATYRAILRDELTALLAEEGMASIEWLMPEQSGFFQPLVTAVLT